jgi:hypothetical protein
MPDNRTNGDGIDAGFFASLASGCFPNAVSTSLIGPLIVAKSTMFKLVKIYLSARMTRKALCAVSAARRVNKTHLDFLKGGPFCFVLGQGTDAADLGFLSFGRHGKISQRWERTGDTMMLPVYYVHRKSEYILNQFLLRSNCTAYVFVGVT